MGNFEKSLPPTPSTSDVGNIYLTDSNSSFYSQEVMHSFTQNTYRHRQTYTLICQNKTLIEFSLPKKALLYSIVIRAAFRGLNLPTPKLLIKGFIQYKQFSSERRGINSASKKNIVRNFSILLYS